MPWSQMLAFVPAVVELAPTEPGVYALHQKGIVILYGVAEGGGGLRATLVSRFAVERNPGIMLALEREVSISWYVTPTPKVLQAELLAKFERVRGRLPRCQRSEGEGQAPDARIANK